MRYMSAFAGEGCLYISKNKKVLITDSRYTEAAGKATSFDVAEEGRGSAVRSRFEIIRDCIADDNVKRLGYEDRSMLCSQFADFSAELQGVEFIPIGDSADKMRRIKKPWYDSPCKNCV